MKGKRSAKPKNVNLFNKQTNILSTSCIKSSETIHIDKWEICFKLQLWIMTCSDCIYSAVLFWCIFSFKKKIKIQCSDSSNNLFECFPQEQNNNTWVWCIIRVSKQWQNSHSWTNYPFKAKFLILLHPMKVLLSLSDMTCWCHCAAVGVTCFVMQHVWEE